VKAFYERYHFVDDSTILMESAGDRNFKGIGERHYYELRNHRVASRGAPQYVADRLDQNSVSF